MAIGKRIFQVVLLLMAFLLPECTRSGPPLIFSSADPARTRLVVEGLQATPGLGPLRVVTVPEVGDAGPQQLRQVRQSHPRLLIVLGSAALRWVAPVEKQLPIVFALVANPYFTGAVYDPAHPEIHQENITGIATPPPLDPALQHGASLLGRGRWGMLYDPTDGAAVELAQLFQRQAPKSGIEPLLEASPQATTDQPALERLLHRGARVLYLPPTAGTGRYAPLVLKWGRELKVRVVSSYPEGSHTGAALWVATDYRRLGEEAGELVARVIKGTPPAQIPIATSTPVQVETDDRLLREWAGYPPLINRGAKGQGRKGE